MLTTVLSVGSALASVIGIALKMQAHVDRRFDGLTNDLHASISEIRLMEERSLGRDNLINQRVAALERDMMRLTNYQRVGAEA